MFLVVSAREIQNRRGKTTNWSSTQRKMKGFSFNENYTFLKSIRGKKIETASTSRLKAMKTIKQCSENRKLETIISLIPRCFFHRAFYLLFY